MGARQIKKFNNYYVVRLKKGEEIITALKSAAANKRIKGAFFFGLGVGKDLVLGYFDAHKKVYLKKVFQGEYEFTSFTGNISRLNKEIIIHCHVTITKDDFRTFGGHLFHGVVPATLEIILYPFAGILRRKKDHATGLNLLDV